MEEERQSTFLIGMLIIGIIALLGSLLAYWENHKKILKQNRKVNSKDPFLNEDPKKLAEEAVKQSQRKLRDKNDPPGGDYPPHI